MTDRSMKTRIDRARRQADRQGMILRRNRARNSEAANFEGFMLIDAAGGGAIDGGMPLPYFLSLEDVEAHLAG